MDNEKPKIHSDKQPSEEFMSAVCNSGTAVCTCEFCGRIHFTPYSDLSYNDKEMEDLKKQSEENPDKYVLSCDDAISWGWMEGKQIVWGCPCNAGKKYEDFIWKHRFVIADYLKYRIDSARKQLEIEKQNVDGLDQLRDTSEKQS